MQSMYNAMEQAPETVTQSRTTGHERCQLIFASAKVDVLQRSGRWKMGKTPGRVL